MLLIDQLHILNLACSVIYSAQLDVIPMWAGDKETSSQFLKHQIHHLKYKKTTQVLFCREQ